MTRSTEGQQSRGPSRAVTVVAAFILVAFGILVIWLLGTAQASSDLAWQRRMYVFGSVQAVVFTAAGALFGVEVKRREVATAVDRADQAVEEASEAKRSEQLASQDAQKGRAMAATARGLAAASRAAGAEARVELPSTPGVARGAGASGFPAGTSPDAALQALARVADELFPLSGGSSPS
jgi:hypothetical protein